MTNKIPDFNKERYSFPVPDMPAVDNKMEPGTHKSNWLWRHYDSTNHNYKNEETLEPLPAPFTDAVTPENPLEVDVYYSMRSPYSYLILQRITYLNSNYNVDVNIKVIFPVAVRTPGMFSGGSGGTEEGHAKGGRSDFWPADIEEAFNKTGLDYQATIEDIQQNPEKYDAVWQQNQVECLASGHGGVPNGVFRGEPFFGQDRFDLLFWRLRQNGLTTRPEPRAPFTTRPLRWPAGD